MKNSQPNKEFISRLMAVQACYQMIHNKKSIKLVVDEYLEDGLKTDDEPGEGEEKVAQPAELDAVKILPHGGLLKKILLGLEERRSEIEEIVKAHISSDKEIEPLLYSILLCGVYELLQHVKTDAPVIVNDYLNVTHEFYSKSQAGFVNGTLDSVAKAVRD